MKCFCTGANDECDFCGGTGGIPERILPQYSSCKNNSEKTSLDDNRQNNHTYNWNNLVNSIPSVYKTDPQNEETTMNYKMYKLEMESSGNEQYFCHKIVRESIVNYFLIDELISNEHKVHLLEYVVEEMNKDKEDAIKEYSQLLNGFSINSHELRLLLGKMDCIIGAVKKYQEHMHRFNRKHKYWIKKQANYRSIEGTVEELHKRLNSICKRI